MTPALEAHIRKMQDMAARYLEPGPYVDLDGEFWDTAQIDFAFINDILHMLDGPEQRAAMAETHDPVMPEIRALQEEHPARVEARFSPDADADGWIKWEGGECPVASSTFVEVRCRDGYTDKDTGGNYFQAGWWQHKPMPWDKDGYGFHHSDIIAYRIIGDAA